MNKPKNQSEAKVLITIKRTGCFGSCPAYSGQIYTDGTVAYEGIEFVGTKGKKQHKIPQSKIKELIAAFEKADYFSMKDEYTYDENGMSVTDQPTTTTSISLNGKIKQVVDYYAAPKKLKDLEDMIDKLSGLDNYIASVPFNSL